MADLKIRPNARNVSVLKEDQRISNNPEISLNKKSVWNHEPYGLFNLTGI